MLAPLPRLYRLVVMASVLVLGIGSGVWLARTWDFPLGGLLVGTAAGLLAAFLLVHDFHGRARSSRVPRRH